MTLDEALRIAATAGILGVEGGRATDEWVGDTPDQVPPARVKDRVWRRFGRCCYNCGNDIRAGKVWTCDHIKALVNGGENRERNLGPLCSICTKPKDRADVAEKSSIYQKRASSMGLKDRKWPNRWPPRGSRPMRR